MIIKKVEKIEELDAILPLIKALWEQDDFLRHFPLSGIYASILTSFFTNSYGIWTGEENGSIIGFIIAEMGYKYFEKYCTIEMAYIAENNIEMTSLGYFEVVKWARENKCKYIGVYSKRAKAIARLYKFEIDTQIMFKQL